MRATWIANGTPPAGYDTGTNRRRTIFGAIDLHTGRFLYQVCRKAVSASFTAFLAQLRAYPAAPLVAVICDNVIIHRSKTVQRWLDAPTLESRCCTGHATARTTIRWSASGPR